MVLIFLYCKNSSVGQKKQMEQRNEIFIDIIEKLNVTVESDGQVVHAEIQGAIRWVEPPYTTTCSSMCDSFPWQRELEELLHFDLFPNLG